MIKTESTMVRGVMQVKTSKSVRTYSVFISNKTGERRVQFSSLVFEIRRATFSMKTPNM
jgi:hypothetical protein